MMVRRNPFRGLALAAAVVSWTGCRPADTSHLSPEHENQLTAETIRARAANLVFRYTHDTGTREAGWEERVASIVVTDSTVLVHKNEKVGIEIIPSSRRYYAVARDHDRVRITAGSGKSLEIWSFAPPDSAERWTDVIRAVIKTSHSEANRPN